MTVRFLTEKQAVSASIVIYHSDNLLHTKL